MKNLIIFIILALFGYNTPVFAQEKPKAPVYVERPQPPDVRNLLYIEPVYNVVDTYPVYTGGFGAFQNFLKSNLKADGETGHVVASFVIEKDGSISNIQVVRSFSDKATAEALRVIKLMPKWKPGINKGKIVRVHYTIPIKFPATG